MYLYIGLLIQIQDAISPQKTAAFTPQNFTYLLTFFAETYKNIYRYLYHSNRPRSGRPLLDLTCSSKVHFYFAGGWHPVSLNADRH